jgi:hypothetical protein
MHMAKRQKPSSPPRFRVGDKVRVKPGVRDPDFPDIPLGGWVGAIEEIENSRGACSLLIAWNQETLAAIHPAFHKRCERDGLEYERSWLAEEDLEPYAGEPLCIEQPTEIKTPALSPGNQDDRIRLILGLTGDDPLPEVDQEMLVKYRDYLNKHLSFPFAAKHCPEDDPESDITVTCLPDPDDYDCDEFYGLFCEARLGGQHITVPLGDIEVKKAKPNYQLVDDYLYWFWNYR